MTLDLTVLAMPTFQYSAYNPQGEFAEGKIEAGSPNLASQLLWNQGLTAFEMKPAQSSGVPWWKRELSSRQRSSLRELASFTREFATLMAADIPLDDALRILCDQANSQPTARIAKDLRTDVLGGLVLSEAMQNQTARFPPDYLSMVRAGEIGGNIGRVLGELADLLERRAEIAARLRSALIYPTMLLALAAASLGIILGVLVPSVAGIFVESGRPLPTVLSLAMALHARWLETLLIVGVVAGSATWACRWTWTRPDMRRAAEKTILKLPIVGPFVSEQEAARFTRTLSTLLRAGVPLLSASMSARRVVHNGHLGSGIDRAIDCVREGAPLHRALQSEAQLPALAVQMISVGEEAGKLDGMLSRVATLFEQKTQRQAERFMTVLTPLLTVVMACIIGGLVMAVIDAVMSVNELAVQ